jgi:hypothetical protein
LHFEIIELVDTGDIDTDYGCHGQHPITEKEGSQ